MYSFPPPPSFNHRLFLKSKDIFTTSVSDPHPFHSDPDQPQNPNADPDPGCQSNADPCGSGYRSLCNKVLVILIYRNFIIFLWHKARLHAFIFEKNMGKFEHLYTNLITWIRSTVASYNCGFLGC